MFTELYYGYDSYEWVSPYAKKSRLKKWSLTGPAVDRLIGCHAVARTRQKCCEPSVQERNCGLERLYSTVNRLNGPLNRRALYALVYRNGKPDGYKIHHCQRLDGIRKFGSNPCSVALFGKHIMTLCANIKGKKKPLTVRLGAFVKWQNST
jgi:hypothetical protein